MANTWHEVQQAIRALRKNADIRDRLIDAYRSLVKVKEKDLPQEIRHHRQWLIGALDTRSTHRIYPEICEVIAAMTPSTMSEAVHRIIALHDGLQAYQPAVPRLRQRPVAGRAPQQKTDGEPARSAGDNGVQYSLFE